MKRISAKAILAGVSLSAVLVIFAGYQVKIQQFFKKEPKVELRRNLERALMNQYWGFNEVKVSKMRPYISPVTKQGPLPDAKFSRLDLLERAGVTRITTRWYNSDFKEVKEATQPGLYGAIVTLSLDSGKELTGFLDTYCLDDQNTSVSHLSDFDSRHWWHELKRTLNYPMTYPYKQYFPPGYSSHTDKKWPLVIFLHGSSTLLPSEQPSDQVRIQNAKNGVTDWTQKQKLDLVAVDFFANERWDSYRVIETLDQIVSNDRIDPDRITLMGFSMGAIATWNILIEYPDKFAAAVPIGGRGYQYRNASVLADIPIWVFNGDTDDVTHLVDAERMVDAVRQVDGNIRLTILSDTGHVPSLARTWRTEALWPWIVDQTRLKSH